MSPDASSPSPRIRRRELYSSRSTAAVLVAIVLILVLAWLATEIVLHVLGRPPLLVAPARMIRDSAQLTSPPASWIVAGGAVATVLGIMLIVLGLAPGRRSRHILMSSRSVIVVDDEVIASGLARYAASAARIDPNNVHVIVSRRNVDVRVIPTSGSLVDPEDVFSAVSQELESYGLEPPLRPPRVQVEPHGRVAA